MFSLICVWINGWGNNRETDDLRRYCAHYGVILLMKLSSVIFTCRRIISQFLVLVVILLNTISCEVDPTLPRVQVDDFTEVSPPYKLLLRTTCIQRSFSGSKMLTQLTDCVWWSWWQCKMMALQWRHNERHGVSNNHPLDCLHNRLFRRKSKKTSKLCVTDLCAGNSSVTGEFPAQRASNADIFFHFMKSSWTILASCPTDPECKILTPAPCHYKNTAL